MMGFAHVVLCMIAALSTAAACFLFIRGGIYDSPKALRALVVAAFAWAWGFILS